MESPSSFFDWHCHGCRARWLATLPSKEWRQQAVDGWRKAGEIEMVAAVIERLKEMARV
jgi:hypothetical protein